MKCASFFAGVGGIDLAFEKNGFEIVYANEIDREAVKTYERNFSIKVDNRDINAVKNNEIPNFDVLIAGFPCQAFSIAGNREGFNDSKGRGVLYFELSRIIKVKKPKVIFLENVKNLVGHDSGNTFRTIYEDLINQGYYVKYKVLNAKDYGDVPQNRERIYIVAFRKKKNYKEFEFPNPIKLKKKITDEINFKEKVNEKYYYDSNCSFYSELKNNVNKVGVIYQWRRKYVRENKSNVCPTLTANMGTGGHNVPIIKSRYGIRKLTPKECFCLQGFPEMYRLPGDVSNTQLYKQAGNSVVVPVISRIAEIISTIMK